MKNIILRYFLFCLSFAIFGAVYASAQDPTLSAAAGDRYVISAKAGGVNFVEGQVTVVRKVGKSGSLLKGDELAIGDRVSTETGGRAEILLNPGSFLRLGENSAFEFKTTELDDLQLKLDKGSVILEVFAADEFKVAVHTPGAKYVLVETGVFRVDVMSDERSRLEVWKGSAKVAGGDVVKTGRVVSVSGTNNVSITKFDRDEKDALDIWSKERSKELAKLSKQLRRNDLRTELMRSFLGRRWNMYGSFGLWIYDPFYGGYCFLPFGNGWSSPYGYGFGHSIWWYNMPPVVYIPPGNPNTGGGSTPPAVTPIRSAGDRSPIPPFIRMEQSMGGGLHGGSPGRGGGNAYDPSGSSPAYSPPSSSSSSSSSPSSPSSAPASTGTKTDATGTKP